LDKVLGDADGALAMEFATIVLAIAPRLRNRYVDVVWGMSSPFTLPLLITVNLTRTPIGVWVAASPELPGFAAVSNNEFSLRANIGEQIVSACRAQGFVVDAAPVGSVSESVARWSIAIRYVTPATGPTKVGDTAYLPATGENPRPPKYASPSDCGRIDQDQKD
jgi:hypothetical protein